MTQSDTQSHRVYTPEYGGIPDVLIDLVTVGFFAGFVLGYSPFGFTLLVILTMLVFKQ